MAEVFQSIPAAALAQLRAAYEVLEYPSFAARLSNVIGMPIEASLRLLPPSWERAIRRAAENAIEQAFELVVTAVPPRGLQGAVSNRLHAGACIGAGALGGFFGLPGLVLELPVTTAVILRSIAGIAQEHGESLHEADTRAACIQVFALGGPSSEDDAAETGYYGMRVAMAAHFSTLRLLAAPSGDLALPSSVLAIRALAARFGLVISDKVAAQLVPVLGAAAGAVVNGLFIRHFQHIATGHFTVRRLEREFGVETVRDAYEALRREPAGTGARESEVRAPLATVSAAVH